MKGDSHTRTVGGGGASRRNPTRRNPAKRDRLSARQQEHLLDLDGLIPWVIAILSRLKYSSATLNSSRAETINGGIPVIP